MITNLHRILLQCYYINLYMNSLNGSYPVFLNIYDLSPMNKYLRFLTLGLYHSAVEIDGNEISFGGGSQPIGGSGIFIGDPLYKQNYPLIETRFVGTIKSKSQIDKVINELESTFMSDQYNVMKKNCNHFTEEFCYRLLKKHIPSYINRLAKIGGALGCNPNELATAPQP